MTDNFEAVSIGIQNAFSFAGQIAQEQIGVVGYEMTRPSVLYRPTVSLDGNAYCVLYGEDLMAGCAGFGRTLAEAMADFDTNWWKQQAPASAMEARRAATGTDAVEDESAAREAGDAQKEHP